MEKMDLKIKFWKIGFVQVINNYVQIKIINLFLLTNLIINIKNYLVGVQLTIKILNIIANSKYKVPYNYQTKPYKNLLISKLQLNKMDLMMMFLSFYKTEINFRIFKQILIHYSKIVKFIECILEKHLLYLRNMIYWLVINHEFLTKDV